jgi:hypothetical protein
MASCFGQTVPRDVVLALLEDVADAVTPNTFCFHLVTYQRAKYHNQIEPWLEKLRPYYLKAKQHYLDRKPMLYVNFATIVRQLCKSQGFTVTTSLDFDKSRYDIVYVIRM